MTVKTVAYSSPFVPAEWIAAHGLEPWQVIPQASHIAAPVCGGAGVCPFAHDFLAEIMAAKSPGTAVPGLEVDYVAAVFTSTCDQMRRLAELASQSLSTFLMHVPAMWQTAESENFYAAELQRLSQFLVQLGGEKPSHDHLVKTMLEYDASRVATSLRGVARAEGQRLALIGGPLRQQDQWIFQHIQNCGGQIVLDATETGERCLPAVYDEAAVRNDPMRELVRAYFKSIPDVFRRPDTMLQEYLQREIKARRVQGVLLIRCIWCDLWHAQLGRLKELLNIPVVEIDFGQDDRNLQRNQTRIDSLLEIAGGGGR
ncbi:MAG: 2-hydroxyacyl-CoA dehydratase family protein [Phycisphaerales bacterium]|nr:2-hydroxyacyl-CoA dehydratase family protein [Phycisphaerales bacterium]